MMPTFLDHARRTVATPVLAALLTVLCAACAVPETNPAGSRQQSEQLPARNLAEQGGDRNESARIRTELAFNYFMRGQMAVALEEVRSAIDSNSRHAPAYNVLGLINMDLGENAKAEDAFKRALALTPNDSDTLNNYGWFLCQTKRERESIGQFLLALKDPLYATPFKPYLNAGTCSQRMGDEAAAEDYFRKAFALDPSNPSTMMRLGELYLKRNDLEKARFYSDRINRSLEPSPDALWLALRIERKGGDRASEASFATQLRRRFPDSVQARLMQQGQFE